MNLERKKDLATEQLFAILKEIGPVDYAFLVDQLHQLQELEMPTEHFKESIIGSFSGSWEQFVEIWRGFHMYLIAKRLWRKFEKIAKRYPNFDTLLLDIAQNELTLRDAEECIKIDPQ